MKKTIAYQGEPGANSHIACDLYDKDLTSVACGTFDQVFNNVINKKNDYAMIPIENSIAGRVADIHRLMPTSGLKIIGEFFLEIHHALMGVEGSSLETLSSVRSHEMALSQCRNSIKELGLDPKSSADTAGSAREISEINDISIGAIASPLAAEIYNLKVLETDFQDAEYNVTRFLIMSKDKSDIVPNEGNIITTLVFIVRSIPASLYKCLGGFASNGVNITKLESYIHPQGFDVAQFYIDFEGHPENNSVKLALEEMKFFCKEIKILGVYKKSNFRKK